MSASSSYPQPRSPGPDIRPTDTSGKSTHITATAPQHDLMQAAHDSSSVAFLPTIKASASNDPFAEQESDRLVSTLRTLTDHTHQFYMSPRTALDVGEEELEKFIVSSQKNDDGAAQEQNAYPALKSNTPAVPEEEEEEEEDDEDGMGNECGYADGREIDERTEKPQTQQDPNFTDSTSSLDLLALHQCIQQEQIERQEKIAEATAFCKEIFNKVDLVLQRCRCAASLHIPNEQEIRSLVEYFVFKATSLKGEQQPPDSSEPTPVLEILAILQSQLRNENTRLEALITKLQHTSSPKDIEHIINSSAAVMPKSLLDILLNDDSLPPIVSYHPESFQPISLPYDEIFQQGKATGLQQQAAEDTHKPVFSHIRISHEDMLPAPENFSMVVNGIYRSSFPRADCFEFLKKIKLKSILVLIPEQYPDDNVEFLKSQGIQFFQVGMPGNKEPFVHVPHATITKALEIAINPENHPILIHCNRGKHRTGCVVGCIRRLQNWSLTMIFDEYRRFAFPKARPLDQQLIELYNDSEIYSLANERDWLPLQW